jgi:hypothetical protein
MTWVTAHKTLVTGVPIPERLKMNAQTGGPNEGKFAVVVLGDGRAGGKRRGTKRAKRHCRVGVGSDISGSPTLQRAR